MLKTAVLLNIFLKAVGKWKKTNTFIQQECIKLIKCDYDYDLLWFPQQKN